MIDSTLAHVEGKSSLGAGRVIQLYGREDAHAKAAAEEARQDQELEGRIEQRLQKWKRGTIWLGVALVSSIATVIPFLYGYPLHARWDTVGKKLLLLAMFLLPVFLYAAATTFNFWSYLRNIKKIHKTFAPSGSKS